MALKEGALLHNQRSRLDFTMDTAGGQNLHPAATVQLTGYLPGYGDGGGGDFGLDTGLLFNHHRVLAVDLAVHRPDESHRCFGTQRSVKRALRTDDRLDFPIVAGAWGGW